MGQMKRQQAREVEEAEKREAQYLGAMTLARICAAGMVTLNVSCRNCTRRGRYRVTRMIDRHGASMALVELKTILAGDCRNRAAWSPHDRCAVYYPGLSRNEIRPL